MVLCAMFGSLKDWSRNAACPPLPAASRPPWIVDEATESFCIRDAKGQALAYVYFEDETAAGRPCTG
jgi:hypothetical protein